MNAPFDLATVAASFFEPLTGQKFAALSLDRPDQPPLELELLAVQRLNHRPGAPGREPFSLFFQLDDLARLAQGIYEFTGPGLEREPVFLVPVRDPLRGLGLEAVFN